MEVKVSSTRGRPLFGMGVYFGKHVSKIFSPLFPTVFALRRSTYAIQICPAKHKAYSTAW